MCFYGENANFRALSCQKHSVLRVFGALAVKKHVFYVGLALGDLLFGVLLRNIVVFLRSKMTSQKPRVFTVFSA